MPINSINSSYSAFTHESFNETSRFLNDPPAKISKMQWLKNNSKEIKNRIITISNLPILQIAALFKKIHGSQIPLKLKYVEFVLGMIQGVGYQLTKITKISGQLFKMIQNTIQATLGFVLKSKVIRNCLNAIKLFTIAAVPFALYDITSNFFTFIKGSVGEKFDALMQMIADCGIIGECIATFAVGLQKFGAVSAQAVQWTTPLFAVSLVLSIATVFLHIKGGLESAWILRQLCKKVENVPRENKTRESYRPLYEYLRAKNSKFFQRHFRVDPVQLQQKLKDAWENAKKIERSCEATPAEKERAFKQITDVVKNLKMQKISRIAIHWLLVVSCAFAIVAGSLILVPPTGPAAYGLMIASVGIAVSAGLLGLYCNRRFKTKMGIVSHKGPIRRLCERSFQWLKRSSRACVSKLFFIPRRKQSSMPQRKFSFLSTN